MSCPHLAVALVVIFAVLTVAFIAQFLYVHWRRRSFRHRSSPAPPIHGGDETPTFSAADAVTKELQYFFCFKPFTPVKLDPPVKNTGGSSPDNECKVIDVFELKEVNRLSRFLSTIKEDKEEAESTPDVDLSIKPPATKDGCLESCVQLPREPPETEAEAEHAVVVTVVGDDGNTNTVFSTPCDSPMYFTPVGSPSRDLTESSVFVGGKSKSGSG